MFCLCASLALKVPGGTVCIVWRFLLWGWFGLVALSFCKKEIPKLLRLGDLPYLLPYSRAIWLLFVLYFL